MKNLIYMGSLLVLFVLAGCEKDLETEGSYRVTYFPSFEVEDGDEVAITPPGAGFTDPGVTAEEDGVQLEITTTVTGRYTGFSGSEVGTDLDEYTYTYSAVNGDGFPGTATRTVAVTNTGDFAPSLEGMYSALVTRSTGVQYDGHLVMIWETATPGTYEITGLIGNYYADGSGYGDGYLCRGGTVTVNDIATNDFDFGQGQFPIWGNTIDITDMTVDVATHTITYNTLADFGGEWNVVLTQL